MKIGIDARMIKATGIGRYTENLIEGLSKIASGNQYILFFKREEFDSYKLPGSNFKKVLADFHWYGIKEQLNFPTLINDQQIDLMHFPHFNVPIFYKEKFIVTIHDLTLNKYKTIRASTKSIIAYELKHLAYNYIIKNSIQKSKAIITPSKFTKKNVIDYFKVSEGKISVTYEGGTSEKILNIKGDDSILRKNNITSPYILYVGNAYPHKNLETLIASVEDINNEYKLVLVGKIDEFYERIKKIVNEKKLNSRIIFTDYVSDEDLVSLYKNAKAYVFPSLNEGFGLPALEALSFGLPVASSNGSCLPEVLGDAAVFFNPNDSKDMADKINKLIINENLISSLQIKGDERVKKFSWDKMAEETLKVYENSLK